MGVVLMCAYLTGEKSSLLPLLTVLQYTLFAFCYCLRESVRFGKLLLLNKLPHAYSHTSNVLLFTECGGDKTLNYCRNKCVGPWAGRSWRGRGITFISQPSDCNFECVCVCVCVCVGLLYHPIKRCVFELLNTSQGYGGALCFSGSLECRRCYFLLRPTSAQSQ